jgi:putative transposase
MWKKSGLVPRRKRRRQICAQARVLLAAPLRVNETWTMAFLQNALASGRKVRTLSIEDAYTREMLAIEVDTSLPSQRIDTCAGEASATSRTAGADHH